MTVYMTRYLQVNYSDCCVLSHALTPDLAEGKVSGIEKIEGIAYCVVDGTARIANTTHSFVHQNTAALMLTEWGNPPISRIIVALVTHGDFSASDRLNSGHWCTSWACDTTLHLHAPAQLGRGGSAWGRGGSAWGRGGSAWGRGGSAWGSGGSACRRGSRICVQTWRICMVLGNRNFIIFCVTFTHCGSHLLDGYYGVKTSFTLANSWKLYLIHWSQIFNLNYKISTCACIHILIMRSASLSCNVYT